MVVMLKGFNSKNAHRASKESNSLRKSILGLFSMLNAPAIGNQLRNRSLKRSYRP